MARCTKRAIANTCGYPVLWHTPFTEHLVVGQTRGRTTGCLLYGLGRGFVSLEGFVWVDGGEAD